MPVPVMGDGETTTPALPAVMLTDMPPAEGSPMFRLHAKTSRMRRWCHHSTLGDGQIAGYILLTG